MLCASRSRQRSISARKAASTSAVPRLPPLASAYLSNEPRRMASRREDAGDLVPAVGVLVEGEVQHPGGGGLVGFVRLDPAVVDRELLEVGEDAQGQLGAPGVAAELVGRVHVPFDVHRGLLGLDEELARAADAEAVVGRLGAAADLDGVLVHHVLVGSRHSPACWRRPSPALRRKGR